MEIHRGEHGGHTRGIQFIIAQSDAFNVDGSAPSPRKVASECDNQGDT